MPADLRSLTARVKSGDLRAMTELGRILVTGDGARVIPVSVSQGAGLLRDAMHRGDGEAAAVLAAMAALGMWESRNLGTALVLLEMAALRGWEPAQRQLRLLARAQDDDWRAMRRRVDVAALRTAPPGRNLCDAPRVRLIEGFATPAECDWMIERGRGELANPGMSLGSRKLEGADARARSEAYLLPRALDVVSAVLFQRLASAIGVDQGFFEFATIQHFKTGRTFGPRADFFDPDVPDEAAEIAGRGQCIATVLLYLNDDYEGAETVFSGAGFNFKGRKGDALWFVNVDRDGAPERLAQYRSPPVASGQKWVLSQWVRSRPLNAYWTPGMDKQTLSPDWIREA